MNINYLLFISGRFEKLASKLNQVPLVNQEFDYSCGSAALSSVLHYWGVFDGPETELHKKLQVTEENGTPGKEIVNVSKELGLKAEMLHHLKLDQLKRLIDNGFTVIVNIQAWPEDKSTDLSTAWEDGHYVVVVGFDKSNIILMDPSIEKKYGYLPLKEFIERWHDYSYDLQGHDYRQAIAIKGDKPNPEIKKIKTEKVG